jgi:two-component system sensor histidine kinase LytS
MFVELLQGLVNQLGMIVFFGFLLSRTSIIKNYILKSKLSLDDVLIFSMIFGGIGIIGTYTGISINDAIANSRSVGVIVGGLFGGPWVGTLSGLIAGIHRMLIPQGRFTAIACGISTIIGGVIAGYSKKYISQKPNQWLWGGLLTFFIEAIQMGIILLIARPYEDALHLVRLIFLPMGFINAVGTAAFILLISQIFEENERAAAVKAQLALNIASETLPILRNGLNKSSANQVAQIILDATGVSAVSLTNKTHILAHVGVGADHHQADQPIHTKMTRDAIGSGEVCIANTKEEIECANPRCRLRSAIVAPLFMHDELIGSLKLYQTRINGISSSDMELAKGLAQLFSTQLELSQLTYQKELLAKTELKALQAQIHPHFLFNALNTIISFCRTDPLKARDLLLKLSIYLRSSFKTGDDFIPFNQEIQHIESFLSIEEARFSDRLEVVYDIDEGIQCMVPPLLLQPLVENALKHGLMSKNDGGTLIIRAKQKNDTLKIEIIDNGVGMSPVMISRLLGPTDPGAGSGGIGLRNVQARLMSIYNTPLSIESVPGKGTTVSFTLPLKGGLAA